MQEIHYNTVDEVKVWVPKKGYGYGEENGEEGDRSFPQLLDSIRVGSRSKVPEQAVFTEARKTKTVKITKQGKEEKKSILMAAMLVFVVLIPAQEGAGIALAVISA